MGRVFYGFARGIDNRPIVTEWVRKSVGCERTYADDLTTYEQMTQQLTPLAAELVRRLEKSHFKGRALVLKVKYNDFRQTTHSHTGITAIEDMDEILQIVNQLLAEVDMNGRSVRLLRLTATSPVVPENTQKDQQLTFDW